MEPTVSQSWFYLAGNQLIGPISLDQLRDAGSAGLVRPDSRVRQGAAGSWCLACQVAGLAAVLPQTPAAAQAPPVAVRDAWAKSPQQPPAPRARSLRKLAIAGLAVMVIGLPLVYGLWMFWPLQHPQPQATAEAAASPEVLPDGLTSGQSVGANETGQPSGPQEQAIEPSGGAAEAAVPGEALAKNEPPAAALASKPAIQPGNATMASRPAQTPFESRADLAPQGKIDVLVFDKLKQLQIPPASLCSDAVFVRRVYLDVIGTLPTAAEAKDFLRDKDPHKRGALIDHLLERQEYADYWALKWSDLLRVKAEFPINLWPNAAQAYHRWIRTCIQQNMPYDRFVRELLTASGSNFRDPQVNFYRALQSREPPGIAQTVALTFMGARAEKWPPDRLAGMAAFFSQIGYKATGEWKEEIVLFEPGSAKPQAAAPPAAIFPDGTQAKLSPDQDPRAVFADWLIDAKNPWFARHIVNRVWYWLLGRGIVHEPDDIRPDNPPQNPELINWLGRELVESHYDLKHMLRVILNSKTYQLSAIPRSDDPQVAANFACYPLRRLEAEVLIDALNQITGSTEKYSSLIPEPFTFIPENQRSIALPDGSITSSFLEMFGRPPRDTGLESERNNRTTAAQRLHLLNSTHIRRKFEQSAKFQSLGRSKGKLRDIVDEIYLTILSRFPSDEEFDAVRAYGDSAGKGRPVVLDVAWALINSVEFAHRH